MSRAPTVCLRRSIVMVAFRLQTFPSSWSSPRRMFSRLVSCFWAGVPLRLGTRKGRSLHLATIRSGTRRCRATLQDIPLLTAAGLIESMQLPREMCGSPRSPPSFLEQERSHTYLGQGFLKRAFMLLAGILVNILTGFLLLMSIYSIAGVSVPVDSNVIGQVERRSDSSQCRYRGRRRILSVDGVLRSSWMDVYDASAAAGKDDIAIEYQRDGKKLRPRLRSRRTSVWRLRLTQVVHLDPSPRRACRSPMFSRLLRA